MATSEHFVYQRTITAEGYMSFENNRGFADYITVSTVPAAGTAYLRFPLPLGIHVRDRFGETIVYGSGTWKKVGETWGYLRRDAKQPAPHPTSLLGAPMSSWIQPDHRGRY